MKQRIENVDTLRIQSLQNAQRAQKSTAFFEMHRSDKPIVPNYGKVGTPSAPGEGKHHKGKHHHAKKHVFTPTFPDAPSHLYKGSDTGAVCSRAQLYKGGTRPLTERQANYLCSIGVM